MKYLPLFLALALSPVLKATHIVGGDLHYICVGVNQYTVELTVYRDCINGISGFDNPASIGVFDSSGNLVLNIEIPLDNSTIEELPLDTGDPCLDPPSNVCVESAIYRETVDLVVPAGGLTLAYQRCCRNTTIINCASNDDIGMTVSAFIPDPDLAVCNSNPAFNQFPPVFICLNEPLFFDHSATDADGDSLVYVLCNPLLTNVPGNYINPPGAPPYPLLDFYPQYSESYPIDSSPVFVLDPVTGLLTGTPSQLGQYVVGICVEEYRDGVLLSTTNRDFQFNIAICSQDIYANFSTPDPCNGLETSFNNTGTGETFYWEFGVDDVDTDTSTEENPVFTFPEEGIYDVLLVANPGFACADSQLISVAAFEPFFAEILYSFECTSSGWLFDFTVDGQFAGELVSDWSIEWNGSEAGPEYTSSEAEPQDVWLPTGTPCYIDFVLSNGYCETSASAEVIPPYLPYATIEPQTIFCEGLSTSFSISSTNAGGGPFLWDFGDPLTTNDFSTVLEPSYTYSGYGTYTATLTIDPGDPCSTTASTTVIILPPDPIDMQVSLVEPDICDSTALLLATFTGSGATSLAWDLGDGTISQEVSILHAYDSPGNYSVVLTAYNDVCDLEEIFTTDVQVGLGPVIRPVRIPNIFTPNMDSRNEWFRAFYEGETIPGTLPEGKTIFDYLSVYHLRIYDRWGIQVFDSADGLYAWDGTFHGDVSEGVYYYVLDYQRKCLDDEVQTESGPVTVVRK